MVSPDDYVAAAKILADDGMQYRFPGSTVPHFHGIDFKYHSVLRVVFLHQGSIALHPYFGGDIIGLQLADNGVD